MSQQKAPQKLPTQVYQKDPAFEQKLQHVFEMIDQNQDRVIDIRELEVIVQNIFGIPEAKNIVEIVWTETGKQKDDVITNLKELSAVLYALQFQWLYTMIAEFDRLDVDKNGQLSSDELFAALEKKDVSPTLMPILRRVLLTGEWKNANITKTVFITEAIKAIKLQGI